MGNTVVASGGISTATGGGWETRLDAGEVQGGTTVMRRSGSGKEDASGATNGRVATSKV